MIWVLAFLWTLALELPIYTAVLRHRRVVAITFAVNAITHPLLWFVFPRFDPYWQYVLAGETCVIAAEALLVALAIQHAGRAIAASLLANVFSTLVGIAILKLIVAAA
jgi:hypothetical protein